MKPLSKNLRLALVVCLSIAGGWLLVHAFKTSVMDFARVTNESMLPYLRPQQVLVLAKMSPCLRNPLSGKALWCSACETGRAYVFYDPRAPERKLVKFALAKPGTTEPHAAYRQRDIIWFTQGAARALNPSGGNGFCYFEGSNREQSVDSRHFGPVPVEQILGKVILPAVQYKEENAGHLQKPAR